MSSYQELGGGITCIDANYGQAGLACFYLFEHEGVCAVIETGTSHSLDNLMSCLADKALEVEQIKYVIPTHVHLDHAGGAGVMMNRFPAATLVVHPKGAKHLIDPQRLVESSINVYGQQQFQALYGEVVPVDADRVIETDHGMTLEVGGRPLRLFHTAGHADHHFCIWDEQTRGWFSGDMFGVSYAAMRFPGADFVMASTTPTQFRPDEFLASVALLKSFDPQRMYLTHYGELAFSDELAQLLCEQVEAYRQFAPRFTGQNDALAQHIMEFTVDCMQRRSPQVSREKLQAMIQFDATLNAQGLAVWLGRRKNTVNGD